MNNEIVRVDFYGDTLEGISSGGRVWVVVKRVCEALGIQAHGQAEKLKGSTWAVTQIIRATGPDGKNYSVFALDLDSVPMWLANIHATKIRPELREKLGRYQQECARALRDHFFGKHTARAESNSPEVPSLLNRLVQLFEQGLQTLQQLVREQGIMREEMATGFQRMSQRFDRLEQRTSASIGAVEQRALHDARQRLASLRVIGKLSPNLRSATAWTLNLVQSAGNWFGRGTQLALLPIDRFPQVMVALRNAMVDAEAAAERERQMSLPLGSWGDADGVIPY